MSKDKEYVDRVLDKSSEKKFRNTLISLLVEIRDLLKELVKNKE